uniref:Uncharacterized protein n=1 Tax=viral metagenome TaxID=1070528 RepID=A0A6C0JSV7_9ZZZZ
MCSCNAGKSTAPQTVRFTPQQFQNNNFQVSRPQNFSAPRPPIINNNQGQPVMQRALRQMPPQMMAMANRR